MSPLGMEALNHRVKLHGVVETVTPLHIGLGRSQGVTGSDLPVLLDILDQPVIPGSSLKGALRTQVEALIRGLGDAAPLAKLRRYCTPVLCSRNALAGEKPRHRDPTPIMRRLPSIRWATRGRQALCY
jgi:CRISPR/Cas system CSM-associated protein Csm3 (group 7 of RAMP superfamily)